VKNTPPEQKALRIFERFGQYEYQEHHQAWIIDQAVRALTGKAYDRWVRNLSEGSDYRGKNPTIERALHYAAKHGCIEDSPHMTWVIDQMARALTGPAYNLWVEFVRRPDPVNEPDELYDWVDGPAPETTNSPRTQPWYIGIAP